MAQLKSIASFLDRELKLSSFTDESNNGLQVENSGKVRKICAGVDASLEFFEKAAEKKADLLICHHGISWGNSLKKITGLNYLKLKFLIEKDAALYACHLPLDAHPEYGNNALICRALGLKALKPFGCEHGAKVGFSGNLPKAESYSEFKKRARSLFGDLTAAMDFGKSRVKTAAVVSGGGAGEIESAARAGIDVFITGEPGLSAYNLAREYGINAIFGGHYATEVFGVRKIAEILENKFSVKAEFIDLGISL